MNFATVPVLEHPAVRLEPLSHTHHDDLVAAAEVDELYRTWYTAVPGRKTMEAEIDRRLQLHSEGRMAPWAIVHPRSGKAMGMTTYCNLEPEHRRLEIGYTWLARYAQGAGVNPAMKLLLLQRAFEDLDCLCVQFRTDWHNHQSRAAIARLGAKQDGVLRNDRIRPDGTMRDTVVFSILNTEWPSVRHGLEGRLAT
ncbi:GNAT family N-acetyltransferase [Kocuria sp.]|uniref:GNAT family N-acetyltransferase n=1 Tax=Kocuria sp. TaxID=1871328 RepID=UPI0026E0FA44|nr:GNAT family protein [Kocuria sp.]MDO5618492.1 GNAT family protein [Kocuria sp.]